jgi:hypothetical protein
MAGFNKMFVMVPVMLAARKLDGEDPTVIYWLRVAYFSVQALVIILVAYTYIQATKIAAKQGNDRIVYIPPAPSPFADPNAKKKYTEIVYSKHILSTARSLLASTLFGIALTTGLHFYKGMIIGLAIQSIMAPFNLIENALVKACFIKGGLEEGAFDEKTAEQLTPDDEVLDAEGNVVVVVRPPSGAAKRSFEEVMLDTWDEGAKANLEPLMSMITKKNCNFVTKENKWTPLMILSGLGAKGTGSAIRQVEKLGGNPAMVDVEGWNALHWAAFHGSLEAAKALEDNIPLLSLVTDKEGKTPLDHAKAEGNDAVAKYLETFDEVSATNKTDEGLRKRK